MSKTMRILLTIFLGVMSAMAPLATDMYLPALPVMQAELGVTASVAQLTLTMTMLGMAFGQILIGPLSDRYGRRRPLLLGMVGFTIAAVGCTFRSPVSRESCSTTLFFIISAL